MLISNAKMYRIKFLIQTQIDFCFSNTQTQDSTRPNSKCPGSVTFNKEHVPYPQDSAPGQAPHKQAQEPLGHVHLRHHVNLGELSVNEAVLPGQQRLQDLT